MKNLYKIWLCSAMYSLHQALNTVMIMYLTSNRSYYKQRHLWDTRIVGKLAIANINFLYKLVLKEISQTNVKGKKLKQVFKIRC